MAIQNWDELENIKQKCWVLGYRNIEKNLLCYVGNNQGIPYLFQRSEDAEKFYNWFLTAKENTGLFGFRHVLKYPELKIIEVELSNFKIV